MLFWKILDDGFFEYELYYHGERPPTGRKKEFLDEHDAKSLLAWILREPFKLQFMRDVLSGCAWPGCDAHADMTESEIIEILAWELVTGRVMMVEREKPHAGWTSAEQTEKPAQNQEPSEQDALPTTSWLVVKMLEDTTGTAAAGVKLSIKFADGYTTQFPAGLTGRLDIRAVAAGLCEIGCQAEDPYIGDCYCYVGEGKDPIEKDPDPVFQGKTNMTDEHKLTRGSHIIEVVAYRVKDYDTLESVAQDHGMTAGQLAYFNYGVKNPDEINRMLFYNVGCDLKTDDGRCFRFESSNTPGLIYIPKHWSGLKLESGREHIVRLKQIRPVIRIDCELDLDDPEIRNDAICLETLDGTWKHKIPVKDLEEVEENLVQLIFPKPPEGYRLNLVQDHKKDRERYMLLQDFDLEDVLQFDFENL